MKISKSIFINMFMYLSKIMHVLDKDIDGEGNF